MNFSSDKVSLPSRIIELLGIPKGVTWFSLEFELNDRGETKIPYVMCEYEPFPHVLVEGENLLTCKAHYKLHSKDIDRLMRVFIKMFRIPGNAFWLRITFPSTKDYNDNDFLVETKCFLDHMGVFEKDDADVLFGAKLCQYQIDQKVNAQEVSCSSDNRSLIERYPETIRVVKQD